MGGRAEPVTNTTTTTTARWFVRGLIIATALGLVIRLVAVAFASRTLPFGDGIWYHSQAQIIADVHRYLAPGEYVFKAQRIPTAEHPPLFPALLAVVVWSGHRSVVALQVTCAFLGAAGIPVVGLVGRRVGGARVGVIAAFLCAVAPSLWQYDHLILSESLLPLTFGLLLLALYGFWDDPTVRRGLWTGAALGLAIYTRSELLLFTPVIAVMVWRHPRFEHRRTRLRAVAAIGLVTAALILPWTVRNLLVLDRPVAFTNNLESVIGGANCKPVYTGKFIGSWSPFCNLDNMPEHTDQSERFALLRYRGFQYASRHLDQLPAVFAARIGRTWEVYQPFQGLGGEGRPDALWIASTVSFWLLAVLGTIGAVRLRRRHVPIWPLVSMAPFVTAMSVLSYGFVRLRVPLDVALIILAAVPLAHWFGRDPAAEVDRADQPDPAAVTPDDAPAMVRSTSAGAPLTTRYSTLWSRFGVPTRRPAGLCTPINAPT